ncbi:MAG TPA: hypothetical protein VH309_08450, partial [Elusimicrobiota bacterium]|nr:hypothetical protein [Elusimicrobiota bacterium]
MKAVLLALALLAPRASAEPTLTVESRAVQRGEILLVVAQGGSERKAPTAEFQGRALEFFPAASTGTWLAFIGLDLDAPTGPSDLKATLRDSYGRAVRKSLTLDVAPGHFKTVRLKVARKFVTPEKSDAERADNEAAQVHDLYA